jgi:hypothetical protein
MIVDAIEFVRAEIRDHLGVADETVIIGPVRRLVDEGHLPGACLSLISVQEETACSVGRLPGADDRHFE